MEKASKRFYYKIDCQLWADGLGDNECTFLLTKSELKALKKHCKEISFGAYLSEGANILDCENIEYSIEAWNKSRVTERYYRKYREKFNEDDNTYSNGIIDEIRQFMDEKEGENDNKEAHEDGSYHQLDLKLTLGPHGSTATVVLLDIEYLALKKNYDPSKEDLGVESWKEYTISKKDYKLMDKSFNSNGCVKKFLNKIGKWADDEELEGEPVSEDEDEGKEKKEEEEEEEEEEEDEDEENNDDEDEEEDEKPLEKKVKRS